MAFGTFMRVEKFILLTLIFFRTSLLFQLVSLLFYLMDIIPKSERTSTSREPTSPLKATHTTYFQKSVGRNTNANWANRINKDFYDLTYDIRFTQTKGKQELKGCPSQFRMKKKIFKLKSKDEDDDQQFDKNKFRMELMAQTKAYNPQHISLYEKQLYSTVQTQGLCKFEFDKTIAGRLKNRKHLHLDFKNQTTRDLDAKSVSPESKAQKYSLNKLSKTIKTRRINQKYYKGNKCHDFDSDDQHRVFSPKQGVDKFYETSNMFRIIKPNRIKETVRMSGIVGRIEPRPKESSVLAYNQYQSKERTMRSPTSSQFTRSPRNIQFGRQVILATRGCYR